MMTTIVSMYQNQPAVCNVIQYQKASEKLASSLVTEDVVNPQKFVQLTKKPWAVACKCGYWFCVHRRLKTNKLNNTSGTP